MTGVSPSPRTLVRNVAVLMSSQVGTWILSVIAAVTIPRYLGPAQVGQLHLAGALWLLGGVVISFGMNLVLTRSVARDRTRLGALLGTSIVVRLLFSLPVSLALIVYGFVDGFSDRQMGLLAILGVGAIVLNVSDGLSATLQGLDRMGSMSIAAVVGRLVFVVGAVGLLLLGYGVVAVAVVTTAGYAVTLLVQLVLLQSARREFGDTGPLEFSPVQMSALLKESTPFFWIAGSIVLYQQVDALIISMVVGRAEVLGWYNAYERLAGTLVFVPTVLMTAVFPTLSRMYGGSNDQTNHDPRLIGRTVNLMLLVSVPIGFGAAAVSEPLVELLFGEEFRNAAPIVAVGGFVLSLTYLTTVLGMFLIAMDKQAVWTRCILLGGLLTIPIDLLLVPVFEDNWGNGAIGAAVGFLITEAIVLVGAVFLLPRATLGRSNVSFATRTVIAGLVMGAVVVWFDGLVLPIRVGLGAVVYLGMVAALRLITEEDRRLVNALRAGGAAV